MRTECPKLCFLPRSAVRKEHARAGSKTERPSPSSSLPKKLAPMTADKATWKAKMEGLRQTMNRLMTEKPTAVAQHSISKALCSDVSPLRARPRIYVHREPAPLAPGEGRMRELFEDLRAQQLKQDKDGEQQKREKWKTQAPEQLQTERLASAEQMSALRMKQDELRRERQEQRVRLLELGGGSDAFLQKWKKDQDVKVETESWTRLWSGVRDTVDKEMSKEKEMYRLLKSAPKTASSRGGMVD